MRFNPDQQAAIETPGSVAITAAAGTGKTAVLAARYLHHITAHGLHPLEIVAITFTEKAASELRSRIREAVSRANSIPDYDGMVAELEAAPISTIHSLAAHICREHPDAAGVSPDFAVMDELVGSLWIKEHLSAVVSNLPQQIFNQLPYSIIGEILRIMLNDPHTTSKALNANPAGFQKIIAERRNQAWERILSDADWQQAKVCVLSCCGDKKDKFEIQRQVAANALMELTPEHINQSAVDNLTGINFSGGKNNLWRDNTLDEVKNAVKTLKRILEENLPDLFIADQDDEEAFAVILPALQQLYEEGSKALEEAKKENRLLTFSDLETHCLQALQNPDIQEYYQIRWKAIMVDEFQDINPIQHEILDYLTQKAVFSVVGDVKQSIYAFRRADVSIFGQVREKIEARGGKAVSLSQSYRMHSALAESLNSIFSVTLDHIHQDLQSDRVYSQPGPYVNAVYIDKQDSNVGINMLRIAEATHVSKTISSLLETQLPVYDKRIERERPIEPRDIAILSHVGAALNNHYEALRSLGVKATFAGGGGNLLSTREAKDVWAMLGFLADPGNAVALVAVLRSPFFAVSDRTLSHLAESIKTSLDWWKTLKDSTEAGLTRPVAVLSDLLGKRKVESASRLLQEADRQTGYSAVIANLPDGERRLADWKGYLSFIRKLEERTRDIFGTIREVERIIKEELPIERPVMTAGNAVTLSTIHGSKGLEWSVVFVIDLARGDTNLQDVVMIDDEYGLAIKVSDAQGKKKKPLLYKYLSQRQKEKQDAEARRVLYVALTRARDLLYLSATNDDKGKLRRIIEGLANAGVVFQPIPYSAEDTLFSAPPSLNPPEVHNNGLVLSLGTSIHNMPATGLSLYSSCPKRFYYEVVENHPGLPEGEGMALRIGSLVHIALENDIDNPESLRKLDTGLDVTQYEEAWAMIQSFQQSAVYAPFRQDRVKREFSIQYRIGDLSINGIVDLVGDNWVLDFKTDKQKEPSHHKYQLWIYARALKKDSAVIAYLRHNDIHIFNMSDLTIIDGEVETMLSRMKTGDFTANPDQKKCSYCWYKDICSEGINILGLEDDIDE